MSNGKICYLEIPAVDIVASSTFYHQVFGWNIRKRNVDSLAFDDSEGNVSGTWVLNRSPMEKVGLLTYVMVDSVEKTIELVKRNGGTIIQKIGVDAPEVTARFTDPAGNVLGLYQEPS